MYQLVVRILWINIYDAPRSPRGSLQVLATVIFPPGSGEVRKPQVECVTFPEQLTDGWAGVSSQVFLTLKQKLVLV